MTESVARLRGEQLTLGYGKYTLSLIHIDAADD